MSPSVADISRKRVCGSVSSGTCQAHAALAVGVVVELVHHHVVHVGVGAFAQRDVGEDLGGAAEDRRVAVDAGVAGEQADVLRAELAAQREELLVDQRLDRAGVDGRACPAASALKCSAEATSDLPEPVGVLRMTFLPSSSSRIASSCAG